MRKPRGAQRVGFAGGPIRSTRTERCFLPYLRGMAARSNLRGASRPSRLLKDRWSRRIRRRRDQPKSSRGPVGVPSATGKPHETTGLHGNQMPCSRGRSAHRRRSENTAQVPCQGGGRGFESRRPLQRNRRSSLKDRPLSRPSSGITSQAPGRRTGAPLGRTTLTPAKPSSDADVRRRRRVK